jgi:hypothetical protein
MSYLSLNFMEKVKNRLSEVTLKMKILITWKYKTVLGNVIYNVTRWGTEFMKLSGLTNLSL